MAYEIIVDDNNNTAEIHYDLCDVLLEKKSNFEFNNQVMYVGFNLFDEIEEFINNHEDYEIIFCKECKPEENKEKYDEEYDDFYEEFDEEDEIDDTRCDIF
ncbi:hypothetical protein [Caminibacter sp.]